MPLVYGEGQHAFRRLQEELIKAYRDDSIFAWGMDTMIRDPTGDVLEKIVQPVGTDHDTSLRRVSFLADSPQLFKECGHLRYGTSEIPAFTMSNAGLEIELPLIAVRETERYYRDGSSELLGWVGLLSCSTEKASEFLGIVLCPTSYEGEASDRPIRAKRLAYGYDDTHHTTRIGARAALHAKRTKVTVIQHSFATPITMNLPKRSHFLVNISHDLLAADYTVSQVTARTLSELEGFTLSRFLSSSSWDAQASVFALECRYTEAKVITFELRRELADVGFTLVVYGTGAMARNGVSLKHVAVVSTCRAITKSGSMSIPLFIRGENGNRRITAAVEEKQGPMSKIYEIEIGLDPAEVEPGPQAEFIQ